MGEARREYPVVMRMKGLWPENIRGFEKHRLREGGDLGHVDAAASWKNQRLLGEKDWAQRVHREIRCMKLENFAQELAQIKKRRRSRELQHRLAEGPRSPWRATRHGPMREVIITAHADWFAVEEGDPFDPDYQSREARFQELAVEWLKETFKGDCVHARADRDEKTYHIHAVVLPRAVTKDGRKMLQPSVHDAISNYEEAQDSVGAWFAAADIGLKRGERRKQKLRDALEHNRLLRDAQGAGCRLDEAEEPLPEHRHHVSPRKWREAQERELATREVELARRADELDLNETVVAAREQDASEKAFAADAVLGVAKAVASGDLGCLDDDRTQPAKKKHETPESQRTLARSLFGRALKALRKRERAAAEAELENAFDQIRAADDVIVRIANLLPASIRRQVASARKSLTRRITALSADTDAGRGGRAVDSSRE